MLGTETATKFVCHHQSYACVYVFISIISRITEKPKQSSVPADSIQTVHVANRFSSHVYRIIVTVCTLCVSVPTRTWQTIQEYLQVAQKGYGDSRLFLVLAVPLYGAIVDLLSHRALFMLSVGIMLSRGVFAAVAHMRNLLF